MSKIAANVLNGFHVALLKQDMSRIAYYCFKYLKQLLTKHHIFDIFAITYKYEQNGS